MARVMVYKRWTPQEDATLETLSWAGLTLSQISAAIPTRTKLAVKQRLTMIDHAENKVLAQMTQQERLMESVHGFMDLD